MKVVLFCGGYGMRMRDGMSDLPKPMHPVGPRPLIWHVMRYYAHFGHTDFVLCPGYGAHHIKEFFLTYSETASNDFVLRPEIFDHLSAGGDLITDACQPLAKEGRMLAFRHRGFWQPADTVKERTALEAAYQGGTRPWMLWEEPDRDPLQAAIAALNDAQVER
jgi:NDP-sugar pyrophosphorylase family protein